MNVQQQVNTYNHILELQAQVVRSITTSVCLRAAIYNSPRQEDEREHQSRELLRQAREMLQEVEQLLDGDAVKSETVSSK
jgi:RecA/RadA recombinase